MIINQLPPKFSHFITRTKITISIRHVSISHDNIVCICTLKQNSTQNHNLSQCFVMWKETRKINAFQFLFIHKLLFPHLCFLLFCLVGKRRIKSKMLVSFDCFPVFIDRVCKNKEEFNKENIC